jgi:teichoic acid transport system permease protein
VARLKNLSRNSPGQIISDIWSRRAFLSLLGYSRVKASLADTNAAGLWWLLEPALQVAVYGTIFGLILPASSRPDNFVISLIIGIAIFQTYQSASTRGTNLFRESRGLEENTSITPWAFAVSTVIETHIKTLAFIVIVYIAALVLGITPSWWWLAFPLVFVWSSFFLYAVSLITASIVRYFPSFPRLLGAFNRLVFYSSGIFWSIERVLADSPTLLAIAQLNPVYQLIVMGRGLLLGHEVQWDSLLPLNALTTVASLLMGMFLFARANRRDCD